MINNEKEIETKNVMSDYWGSGNSERMRSIGTNALSVGRNLTIILWMGL